MTARRRIRVKARPLAFSLAKLGDAGERLPGIALGSYRVSLQPSGALYVSRTGLYLGRIESTDVWRVMSDASPVDIVSVKTLVEKFVDVAAGAAMLTDKPRCAVCGRVLGTALAYLEDRARGIGKSCWEKGEFSTFERRTIAGGRKRGKMKSLSRKTNRTRSPKHGK